MVNSPSEVKISIMASNDASIKAAALVDPQQQQHTAGSTVDAETLRNNTLCEIQNMFSGHIDPDVVQLVLSECDYNVNEAVETLMILSEENSNNQGADNSREAPAVMDEILMEDVPLLDGLDNQTSDSNNEKKLACSTQEINAVGGVPRENNRISFIDTFSNEVYSSNEALYNDGHEDGNSESSTKEKSNDSSAENSSAAKPQDTFVTIDNKSNSDENNACMGKKVDENAKIVDSGIKSHANSDTSQLPAAIRSAQGSCDRVKLIPPSNSQQQFSHSVTPFMTPTVEKNSLLTNSYWIQQKNKVIDTIKTSKAVLVVLRGIPGSGKSTLAKQLKFGGRILSSDDFFIKRVRGEMIYDFNPMMLEEAHNWNHKRTEKMLSQGLTPIIIDNTNTEIWEMKPYLALGIKHGYLVFILEPTTPWKFKARELTLKNSHGVPRKSIERMLMRYDHKHPDIIMQETCEKLNVSKFYQQHPVHLESNNSSEPVSPQTKKMENVKSVDEKRGETVNIPKNSSSEAPSNDFKELSLQDLLTLSRQDSDCSKSSPEERSEVEMDFTSWVDVTEQDKEFSWTHSKGNSDESQKCLSKSPVSPNSPLKSCLKKTKEKDYSEMSSTLKSDPFEKAEMVSSISDDVNTATWDIISVDQNVKKYNAEGESPKDSDQNFSEKQKKKPTSLKHFSLLDAEMRSKFCNENWILPTFPSPKVILAPIDPDLPKVYADNSSITCDEDFVLLYKIQNNVSHDDLVNFKVRNAHPRVIADQNVETVSKSRSVLKLDKSSMTDEPPPASFESTLKSLEVMFPQLPLSDLADILQKCHGNHQWAINILLDSGSTEFLYESTVSSFGNSAPVDQNSANNIPDVVDMTYREKVSEKNEETDSKETRASMNDFERFYEDTIPMKLDPEFASQLVQSFGPVLPNMSQSLFSEDDLTLDIPHALAFQLYAVWNKQLGNKPSGSQFNARNNASAEGRPNNARKKRASRSRSRTNKTRAAPITQIPSEPEGDNPDDGIVSFKEIMDHEKALELSRKEAAKALKNDMAIQFKRSFLKELYPNIDEIALNDLFEANRFSLENTLNAIKIAIGEDKNGQEQFASDIAADCEQRIQNLSTGEDFQQSTFEELSADELRMKAREYQEKKKNYSQKAQEANSRGMPSVASYYSREAQLEGEKVNELNNLAAKAILIEKNSGRSPKELDLHGLYVSEAVREVKKFVSKNRQVLRDSSCRSFNLHIITGKGSHSDKGVPKVKKAVISYLHSCSLPYIDVNSGLIQVILSK